MHRTVRELDRVLPALLMAASVTLLAFGLLSYGAPAADGLVAATDGRPSPTAVAAPPDLLSPPSTPRTTVPPPAPGPSSSLVPSPTLAPSPSAASPSAPASASPVPSPTATAPPAAATRVVVRSHGIDLPVISGDVELPGQGPELYPLCDVAQYLTRYGQPSQPGTTYLYGHAREGMFLPLLSASERNDGASLVGALVEVYTDDDRLHLYEIFVVKRHAIDFSLADEVPPGEHRLILQTSEGPPGTIPKLQVGARRISESAADGRTAHPVAKPRACYDG